MGEFPQYHSETEKIFPKIQKYLYGMILDIGCNNHKVLKEAIGVDQQFYSCVDYVTSELDHLSTGRLSHLKNKVDVVFSSHCLEHFQNDIAALIDWSHLLKQGGHLVLYLPDDRHYDNFKNPEHLQRYTLEKFVEVLGSLRLFKMIESGMDVGYDKYSFYVVAQKI